MPVGDEAQRGVERAEAAERGEAGQHMTGSFLGGLPSMESVAEDAPLFVISIAAQLANMHPQTLRQYDRVGLVTPGRTNGGGRRYSPRDIAVLRLVQRLSQDEGINLAGIKRIIDLEHQVDALRARVSELVVEITEMQHRAAAAEAAVHASYRRDLLPFRTPGTALVRWQRNPW